MIPKPQPEHTPNSGLLETALRVLSALMERRRPDPIDVQRLRASAKPRDGSLPPDDLARLIVEREIARRSRR